jgi:hypothetical protein
VTLDNESRLFVNGELETRDYKVYISYWMENYQIADIQEYRRLKEHKKWPLNKDAYGMTYLGKDSNSNQYWHNSTLDAILVFNEHGYCQDFFKYDNNKSKTLPAIHPSGDVHFLDYDKNGVYLLRIENVWDKVGRAFWYETNATVTAPNVRLRKQPSLTGGEAGYLQTDERIVILETTAETTKVGEMNAPWYRVKSISGMEAWAYGGFIEKDEE